MFKKISLSVLLCLPVLGLADFNPYDVFSPNGSSSSDSSQSSSTSTSSTSAAAGAAPSAASTAPSTSQSTYVQPGALIAPATTAPSSSANTGANSSTLPYRTPNYPNYAVPGNNSGRSSSLSTPASLNAPNGANVMVSIPSPSGPITPVTPVPTGGGGNGGSLLAQINQGVQTINSNMITWKSQEAANETAAAAQLVPSTSTALNDFLANQSGYQSLANLPLLNSSESLNSLLNSQGSPLVPGATQNGQNMFQTAFILYPTTVADMQALNANSNGTSAGSATPQNNFLTFAAQYTNHFLDVLPSTATTLNMNYQSNIFSLIGLDFAQISAQTKPIGTLDSQMSMLQNAVNAPFSPTADQASGQTWFQQLSTASTPQLLRSVAILVATQNQMQYSALQNLQTLNAMQAGQLTELAAIDQKMQQMLTAQQQTNVLLQKMLTALIAQSNKK